MGNICCSVINCPFLKIASANSITDTSDFKKFFETPNIKDTINPSWGGINLKLRNVCNGELDLPIRFEVFCEIPAATDLMYGYCETTVRKLSE